ncbi:MAG TPA: DUF3806 domain-containing protein [Thermoanaerobaculia bacterium]|nr:DUF3806 domain-containing protein [Thermoanaerobaculia bacterium]
MARETEEDAPPSIGLRLSQARAVLEHAELGIDVTAAWAGVELLRALDRSLEARRAAGAQLGDELVRAAGAALGARMAAVLTLDWIAGGDGEEPEVALRFAGSEVVLYPERMVRAHLAGAARDGTTVCLERLVESAAGYLDHLVRYFPSRLGLERRSRGARRRTAPEAER